MKNWYATLTQREQLSVMLLGVAVVLYFMYMFILSPLNAKRDALAEQNRILASSLTNVDVMVSEILRLRNTGVSAKAGRNLTSLVNQSTGNRNIAVSRLQPNSRGELQVRLENTSFDDFLGWLYDMEYKEGLLVREVSITEGGGVGRINATVRIAQAG
jgi:type II secretory pathway component PulM